LENGGAVVSPLLLDDLQLKSAIKSKSPTANSRFAPRFDEEPGGASGFPSRSARFHREKSVRHSRNYDRRRTHSAANSVSHFGQSDRTCQTTARKFERHDFERSILPRNAGKLGRTIYAHGKLFVFDRTFDFSFGGVGVWNVARVFVEQKRKSVAVLKCLGAPAQKSSRFICCRF
jgi:predicted lysophospholipase L1 biosynthesis ABC-type transport system permease subunit